MQMRTRAFVLVFVASVIVATSIPAADNDDSAPVAPDLEDLLQAGQQLWDEYAPPEVKAEYEFPTLESVEAYLADLQRAFQEGTFEDLAAYELDATVVLRVLGRFEGGDELVDWLTPRVDYLVAARELPPTAFLPPPPPAPARTPPARSPEEAQRAVRPAAPPAPPPVPTRPYWDRIIVGRQPPARAAEYVPRLKKIFTQQGVPPELVWLAEVESSMNPKARSPVGARGLFQFMPETAQRFGLRTSWPDERNNPDKSAHAAANYLRILHGRFGSWPLALAAYNAGEGRVGRAMTASGKNSFAELAPHLPSETRLYVPKVLATVAARESVDPEALPAPTP